MKSLEIQFIIDTGTVDAKARRDPSKYYYCCFEMEGVKDGSSQRRRESKMEGVKGGWSQGWKESKMDGVKDGGNQRWNEVDTRKHGQAKRIKWKWKGMDK